MIQSPLAFRYWVRTGLWSLQSTSVGKHSTASKYSHWKIGWNFPEILSTSCAAMPPKNAAWYIRVSNAVVRQ